MYDFELLHLGRRVCFYGKISYSTAQSRFWIAKFMKRNYLSLPKPHAEKRAVVREEEIDAYLNSLADAIIKYGIRRILKMDETHINTFAQQIKTIAISRQETVKINATKENLNILKEAKNSNFKGILTGDDYKL